MIVTLLSHISLSMMDGSEEDSDNAMSESLDDNSEENVSKEMITRDNYLSLT